jgi:peptidoglycan/LPS O-acetylase OafA/YrhL
MLTIDQAYPSEQRTIPSLNGIRAISVLIVVLSHSGLGMIVPGGLGVTIFFFLSGYLIVSGAAFPHIGNVRVVA